LAKEQYVTSLIYKQL